MHFTLHIPIPRSHSEWQSIKPF
ncbi:hypothetical protein OIU74_022458 [Salix koriyanagi]|uniref:Uncharacterized protein n=1 Tax=Salix koriyanagi TaxID=2511006 RepID=A0A9Q0WNE0_9ROSI|nr:hypothetical protein OIU74_022458 [Salix koriyanagi]